MFYMVFPSFVVLVFSCLLCFAYICFVFVFCSWEGKIEGCWFLDVKHYTYMLLMFVW